MKVCGNLPIRVTSGIVDDIIRDGIIEACTNGRKTGAISFGSGPIVYIDVTT